MIDQGHMPQWRRVMVGAAIMCASAPAMPLGAQATTNTANIPLFTYRDAALAGTFVLATLAVRPLDDHYARRLQDSSTQANRKLHNLATFVRTTAAPGSYIIGTTMYLAGRASKDQRLQSLGFHGTEALLLGDGLAYVLKGFVGRQRPFVEPQNSHSYSFMRGFGGNEYQSFPSGHSVAAFAAAAAVTSETAGWWPNARWYIGSVMYTGAALTGASRMYDNMHWASDVIVGAGIGTFAGLKVVRYHNTHPGNQIDRWFITGSMVSTDNGGHAVRWSLVPRSWPSAPNVTH